MPNELKEKMDALLTEFGAYEVLWATADFMDNRLAAEFATKPEYAARIREQAQKVKVAAHSLLG